MPRYTAAVHVIFNSFNKLEQRSLSFNVEVNMNVNI